MFSGINTLVVLYSQISSLYYNPCASNNTFFHINMMSKLDILYYTDFGQYSRVHHGMYCQAYYRNRRLPDNLREWEFRNVTLYHMEVRYRERMVDSRINYFSINYHVNGLDTRTWLRSFPTSPEYPEYMRALDGADRVIAAEAKVWADFLKTVPNYTGLYALYVVSYTSILTWYLTSTL